VPVKTLNGLDKLNPKLITGFNEGKALGKLIGCEDEFACLV